MDEKRWILRNLQVSSRKCLHLSQLHALYSGNPVLKPSLIGLLRNEQTTDQIMAVALKKVTTFILKDHFLVLESHQKRQPQTQVSDLNQCKVTHFRRNNCQKTVSSQTPAGRGHFQVQKVTWNQTNVIKLWSMVESLKTHWKTIGWVSAYLRVWDKR